MWAFESPKHVVPMTTTIKQYLKNKPLLNGVGFVFNGATVLLPMISVCDCRIAAVFQLMMMTVLVFRSTTTERGNGVFKAFENCTRILLFVGAFTWLETRAEHPLMKLLSTVSIAYVNQCLSDYMCHRFIWHAHWSHSLQGLSAMFWVAVKTNYIQHYMCHHKLSHDPECRELMDNLIPIPTAKHETVDKPYIENGVALSAIGCTNYGIRVDTIGCKLHMASLHWTFLTVSSFMYIQLALGNTNSAMIHFLSAAIPVAYLSEHDKFHASEVTRISKYGNSWLKYIYCTKEYDNLCKAHIQHHHDPKYSNQRYGLIPYNRFVCILVFGEY